MSEIPEQARDKATPNQLAQQLEVFRQQHKHGMMTAAEFNDALKLFRFTDDVGHIWTLGANSGKWYRWELDHWAPNTPPTLLIIPATPIDLAQPQDKDRRLQKPPSPRVVPPASPQFQGKFCTQCGSRIPVGDKFCANCGTRIEVAQSPRPVLTLFCSNCGKPIQAGKKFCTSCGQKTE